ncbi:hypothetical protein NLJ89_g10469 [Agrocybe chaxingu]|uniref:Heterokaryon incompatibility domain-containing protein n=1 Tax=Agrocybe chaxingu TaxID=84603 RepID=A0A9W8JY44_9AGAR|nr:hypothetical protein NLJ89_g10469 [Agrocybe chaxingu]
MIINKKKPGGSFGAKQRCGIQIFGGGGDDDEWGAPIFTGRKMKKGQTDYDLVKRWVRYCMEQHTASCRAAIPTNRTRFLELSLRLIDVNRGCVVPVPHGGCRYFALSYVWGSVISLRLSKANYTELSQPGALSSAGADLPKTITDAIYFVRNLGETYLWVDSLCIIQDSLDDKAVQIPNMDIVYQSAVLTIVAAAGKDANAGLPGARPWSRQSTQVIAKVQDMTLSNVQRPFHWGMPESAWSSRGWTFQEKVLSTRRLVFTDSQTYFECPGATWCEDMAQEPFNAETHKIHQDGDMSTFPSTDAASQSPFGRYGKLVEEYSMRNLSFEKDAIDAFSGILSMLQPKLDGTEYIFGLPECDLHTALLWNPQFGCPHVRRDKSKVPGEDATMDLDFPTWSWAGWQTHVDYRTARAGGSLEGLTIPRTTLYMWMPDSQQLRRVGDKGTHGDQSKTLARQDSGAVFRQITSSGLPLDRAFLYFITHSARFRGDDDPSEHQKDWFEPKLYRIRSASGDEVAHMSLPTSWHKNHRAAEFVLLSRDMSDDWGPRMLNVLLVEWDGGQIGYRVGMTLISEDHWNTAGPVEKLVCLG